jgi:hypothetical protein
MMRVPAACGLCPMMLAVFSAGCAEHVLWHGHTADRREEIRIVESGGAQHVFEGRHELSAHAAVGIEALAVEGDHVAYPARDSNRWHVVVDGVSESTSWDGVGAVALAPNGARLLYAAVRAGSWYVVDRGVESIPFDSVQSLGFDELGRSTFAATVGEAVRVYVDGRPGPIFSEVRSLTARPSFHYVGVDEAGEHYVDRDRISVGYERILEVADEGFLAKGKDGREAVVRGEVVARGEIHRLVTGSGHYGLVRREATYEVAVIDGREEALRWSGIESLSMSADGTHYGYVADSDAGVAVVVDAMPRGSWERASAPLFAKTGGSYAYVASTGSGDAVVTARARYSFDVVVEDSLVLDDTGQHWAIVAGFDSVRRLYEVVDGKTRAPFDLDEWIAARASTRRPEAGDRLRAWLRCDLARVASR